MRYALLICLALVGCGDSTPDYSDNIHQLNAAKDSLNADQAKAESERQAMENRLAAMESKAGVVTPEEPKAYASTEEVAALKREVETLRAELKAEKAHPVVPQLDAPWEDRATNGLTAAVVSVLEREANKTRRLERFEDPSVKLFSADDRVRARQALTRQLKLIVEMLNAIVKKVAVSGNPKERGLSKFIQSLVESEWQSLAFREFGSQQDFATVVYAHYLDSEDGKKPFDKETREGVAALLISWVRSLYLLG